MEPALLNSSLAHQSQNEIIDVWSSNLDEEMTKISYLLDDYPIVAMDTEFPGFFWRSEGQG
jgi:hypothetical protein